MATIQTSIKLIDGMSPVLHSMHTALNIVLNSFEAVQHATNKPIDTAAITTARNELAKAATSLDKIENEINQNTDAQKRFNNTVKEGGGVVSNLMGKMTALIGAYAGYQAVGGIVKTADQMQMTNARLNLVNDGMQTTEQLQDKIYQSALRSRGAYADTADAVAKLGLRAGDIFSSNDETIQFVETLNKMFVIAGASTMEMNSATLQLTQALGSGVLRGQEFNAVFEAAPNVMQALADHMGIPIGELRSLAEEGDITAQTVKDALFAATDKVNEQFASMPFTFAQAWQTVKNKILEASMPILQTLSDITSSERFIKFADGVGSAVERIMGFFQNVGNVVMPILGGVYDILSNIVNFFSDNWSVIAPAVWGVVVAMTAYKVVTMAVATWTGIVATAQGIYNGIMALAAAKSALMTGATYAQVAAQYGLNAAMYACPVTWIIIAIIALIAIFYAAVAAVNKFAGTSYSATGMICGAFKWLGAAIANIFIGIWNVGYGCVQWVVEAWNWCADNMDSIFHNIGAWWNNLWIDAEIGFNKFIAKVLDKLGSLAQKIQPLAELFDFDLSGILNGTKSGLANNVAALAAQKKQQKALTAFNPNIDWQNQEYFNLSEAYQSGYDWGAEKAAQAEDFLKGLDLDEKTKEIEEMMEKYKNQNGNQGSDGMGDIGKALSGQLGDSPALDSISNNVGNISDNLESIDKSLSVSDDEMNYIRKLASREAIDNVTRGDMTINVTNYNQIKDSMDVEAVAKELAKKVNDEIQANSEGLRY